MSKRKTKAENELDGNPGKRPLKPKARPDASRPLEPTHLEPVGLAEWRRITESLEQSGKLCASDSGLILSAALSHQRVQEAEGIISDQGIIVEGDKGVIVKNPACQVARDYATQYRETIKLLGISASVRADAAPADKQEDPFGDLD